MPQIPVKNTAQVGLPGTVANPAQEGMFGRALQVVGDIGQGFARQQQKEQQKEQERQGLEEFSLASTDLTLAFEQNRRATEASLTADTDYDFVQEKFADDLQQTYDKTLESVANPVAQEMLHRARPSLIGSQVKSFVGTASNKREEFRIQGVEERLDGLYQQAVEADPETRLQMMELAGNVMNTTNLPDAKKKHWDKRFTEEIFISDLHRQMDEDPGEFLRTAEENPIFQELDPSERRKLTREAIRLSDKQEADEEKKLKKRQDVSAFHALQQVVDGTMTERGLRDMVSIGQISPSQGRSLLKSLSSGEVTQDNPYVLNEIYEGLGDGSANPDVILNAHSQGWIKPSTTKELLRSANSNVTSNPRYKQGLAFIRSQTLISGPLGAIDLDSQQRLGAYNLEYFNRAIGGEDPLEVAKEIVGREASGKKFSVRANNPLPAQAKSYKREDLKAAEEAIINQYMAKEISYEDAQQELGRLEELMRVADE